MSLLEQKRLQWAKERAQIKAEWNPWGRPGCGAPLAMGNASCQPVLDWSSTSKVSPHAISPDSTKVIGDSGRRLPPLPLTLQSFNSKVGVGPNFSSPLLFGLGSEPAFPNGKFEEEQKQNDEISEYHELTHNEINRRKSSTIHNPLSLEPSEGRQTPGSLSPSFSVTLPLGSHTSLPALDCLENAAIPRSFLRGANIPLDPEVRAELELKRRKQREQQLAIQTQLEEKQRRIREEKERIRREEAKEEEQFIEMNQKLLQQQILEEEQRIKVKFSPVVQPKQPDTQSSRNLAQSNQEVQSIPTPPAVGDSQSISSKSGLSDTNTDVSKAPIQIPRVASPYIENRLLTPTKYRGTDLPRECGTQTDTYLSNKKDVAIDTEKEVLVQEEVNRKSKSDGKSNKQKQERNHEVKYKPKWGAHQSQKAYQRQSDKDVLNRRLEEMRQKRLREEALIQLNQPQVGSNRTRSSARHQRYLLARETISPLSASSSYSNSPPNLLPRQSSTDSTTAYDSSTESYMRRQRRQWDSPRGDELPNFYTQPLAGRRNSRSQSSAGLDTPDIRTPMRISRDISPSAPVIPAWNSTIDLYQHSQPIAKNRMHNSLENVRINHDNNLLYVKNNVGPGGRMSDAWSTQSMPVDRYLLDFVPYSRSSVILGDGTSRSAPFVHNRILQQLSTIRQGLLMKQKQMEHFLNAGREFSLPDKTYGT
uniref:CCDC66 domain-containing protein n=1 Tax=Strigamia maritima TaxID=126957 RepID=T1JMM6_STRMM